MKRTILRISLFVSLAAVLGCAVTTRSSPSAVDPDLASLSNYRHWTLVNPTPQLMEPQSAISCAIIPGRQEPSPHLHKYISVFVNPVGREEMMTKQSPIYEAVSVVKRFLSTL